MFGKNNITKLDKVGQDQLWSWLEKGRPESLTLKKKKINEF